MFLVFFRLWFPKVQNVEITTNVAPRNWMKYTIYYTTIYYNLVKLTAYYRNNGELELRRLNSIFKFIRRRLNPFVMLLSRFTKSRFTVFSLMNVREPTVRPTRHSPSKSTVAHAPCTCQLALNESYSRCSRDATLFPGEPVKRLQARYARNNYGNPAWSHFEWSTMINRRASWN